MLGLIIAFIIVIGGFSYIIFDIASTRTNTTHQSTPDGLDQFFKDVHGKQKQYTLQRKRG